jgi:UDP-N-acetylglucosamine acyltransferase
MSDIHPTAIVDARAALGTDVTIGPYCIVGPDVRLGDRAWLQSMVRLDGPTTIGADCRFYHGAVLGNDPQDLKFRGTRSGVRVGERNTFREFSTVHRATGEGEATVIGSDNLVMAYAHIAHNCVVADRTILSNSANLAGHVELGAYAIIGGVTPVHQFVRIGPHAIVGGGCRVPKDVPPYVLAAGHPLGVHGLNSIGLRRRGFTPATLTELEKLYRIFFRSGLVKEAAVARIRGECQPLPEVELFCSFVERSARGLTR